MQEDLYFKDEKEARRYKTIRIIKLVLLYLALVLFAFFTLLPFYWMIATSLKTSEELGQIPTTFFPHTFDFSSYQQIFDPNGKYFKLIKYMGNTIFVAICTTAISIVVTTLAAFAFARLSFKGKDFIFTLLLSTMMIPGEMMIITNFTTVANLGWLNSYQALIIPFTASVFYTFFLRQSFKQIPDELYYAAKVDGNSDFKYLFKVMIPIARPTIITIIILSMIGSWNAYIWPRTVVTNSDMKLVTDGIMSLFSNDTGGSVDNQIMAGATVVSLPLLIAFILFRKYIMNGVSRSGIKG